MRGAATTESLEPVRSPTILSVTPKFAGDGTTKIGFRVSGGADDSPGHHPLLDGLGQLPHQGEDGRRSRQSVERNFRLGEHVGVPVERLPKQRLHLGGRRLERLEPVDPLWHRDAGRVLCRRHEPLEPEREYPAFVDRARIVRRQMPQLERRCERWRGVSLRHGRTQGYPNGGALPPVSRMFFVQVLRMVL